MFEMWIDNKKVLTKENTDARKFDTMKVFAAGFKNYAAVEGKIKNLYIWTKNA